MVIINQLILAGGGFKGGAYVGMYQYLEEMGHNKYINTIAGTSIGAFFGTLICMGYSSTELRAAFLHFDYNKYQSIDLNFLFEKFGLDSSEKISKFITLLFIAKGYKANVTFQSLYEKTKIHLIMNAVCINTHQSVIFDHLKTPSMFVIKAMLASMALPFLFSCVTHDDLIYCDGGVVNNFLIDLPQCVNHPDTVLGINLNRHINYSVKNIDNIGQYCQQLLSCIHNICQQVVTNKMPHPDMHIINLSSPKFGTFNFDLSEQDKLELINIGYQKTKYYFEIILPQKLAKKRNYSDKPILEQLHQLLSNNLIKEALTLIEKQQLSIKKEYPMKEGRRKSQNIT